MQYSLGIDSGSTTTKGVLFDGRDIVKYAILPTSKNPSKSVNDVYDMLYNNGVLYTVSTGYGRDLLVRADKKITEITCHAQGSAYLNPNISAVVDIGGQDSKAIAMDRMHNVVDFVMNDKCAAGTGRFIEIMMRTLGENIETIDEFVLEKTPVNISSMCTVFAESEIVGLLAAGVDSGDIALGIIHSVARRTANFCKKLRIEGDVFFSGGLARFEIFRKTLEHYLDHRVFSHGAAQYAGAIGAAVIAYKKIK